MRRLMTGMIVIALATAACSSSPSVDDPLTQAAVIDLAARLDVEESAITVVSVEEVTWSDGSLGCPEPDMMYTQALENGSLIVLEVDGTEYKYHSGVGRDLFYCLTPVAPVGEDSGDT